MESLSRNKVLVIAPSFHNYISNIASAFKNLGAEVEYYSQDPTTYLFYRISFFRLGKIFIFKSLFNNEILKTNKTIFRSLEGKKFDHVVIIKGDLLTDDFLLQLRNSMPDANFVMYQWDSINNCNYADRIKYFNVVYSFDYADCAKYKEISYLPCFFSEDYAKIALIKDIKYEYSFFFLGTNHTIRVQKLLEMIDFFEKKELKYSVNLITSRLEKIQLANKRSKINCFLGSLKFDQFSENYIKSKAIIDISSPRQTGLSMRIIEALGANKKIITINSNIVNESFYDPKMIFIWGKDDPEDLVDFLNQEHEKPNSKNYSIESFVLNLLKMPG